MKDLIDFLKDNTIWIVSVILFIFYLIIEIYKDWDSVKHLFLGIWKVVCKAVFVFRTIRRDRYFTALGSTDYVEWERKTLNALYSPAAEEYERRRDGNASGCKTANLHGQLYDAVYFGSAEPIKYPFSKMYKKEELKTCGEAVYKCADAFEKKHYNLLKTNIRFPNKIGYMLDGIDFSGGHHFTAYTGVYKANLCTSHILEYELYRAYMKFRGYEIVSDMSLDNGKIDKKNGKLIFGRNNDEFLRCYLPKRKAVHDKMRTTADVFTSGAGRYSLIGVQAVVLCKNHSGGYDLLRIRRSRHVAAKAGFLQFIPSGGFEAYDNGTDFDTRFSNFSLPKALIREFAEECLGVSDDKADNMSAEAQYADEKINKLLSMVEDEGSKTNIYYLGDTLGFAALRHELCFLFVIDDPKYADNIKANMESSNVIGFIDIRYIRSKKFWKRSDKENDLKKLNPTSAALWCLVEESGILETLGVEHRVAADIPKNSITT